MVSSHSKASCTVNKARQRGQLKCPWEVDPALKWFSFPPTSRFLIPIAFQQTNRPVPVVYSLNTEFQLCNNEKVFLMDPNTSDMSLAEMDYKGAFSKGELPPPAAVSASAWTVRDCA